jgi:hypothetical protein
VDAGDEPTEFLSAFGLESMVVTERLPDMRYVRNIERERMGATITDVTPTATKAQIEGEYFSPALQDTSDEVVMSSFIQKAPTGRPRFRKSSMVKPSTMRKAIGLSEEQQLKIKERILETNIPDDYMRTNLILGHTLFAAVSKTAKVFGKDVEEAAWEPVKKVPKDMLELENHVLRVYFDEKKGIVEALEVLEKEEKPRAKPQKPSPSGLSPIPSKSPSMEKSSMEGMRLEKIDFSSMTVKDLKAYAEENKIELPAGVRKAEIIDILEKSTKNKTRRKLPEIPKAD